MLRLPDRTKGAESAVLHLMLHVAPRRPEVQVGAPRFELGTPCSQSMGANLNTDRAVSPLTQARRVTLWQGRDRELVDLGGVTPADRCPQESPDPG